MWKLDHSAVFPYALPEWFIKLFTKQDEVVLDPFMGVATTAIAAQKLRRKYVGIELKKEYRDIAVERLDESEALV